MKTPDDFYYKGWSAQVSNQTGAGYMAFAHNLLGTFLYVDVQRGKGANARATEAIKQKIDERDTR